MPKRTNTKADKSIYFTEPQFREMLKAFDELRKDIERKCNALSLDYARLFG